MFFCNMDGYGLEPVQRLFAEEMPVSNECELMFPDGSRYKGQVKEGVLQGHGELIYSDGSKYTGTFFDNEMNGRGMFIFQDGTRYEGEFEGGRFSGRGILSFPDHSRYEGAFRGGQYHGYGKWYTPDGIRYEGEFLNNLFDGQGFCLLPDGSRYDAFFSRDDATGDGSFRDGGASENIPSVTKLVDGTSDSMPAERISDAGTVSDEEVLLLEKKGDLIEAVEGLENKKQIIDTFSETSDLVFSVQVGAFLLKENAEKLAMMLREKGYDVRTLIISDAAGTPWYTVRLVSDQSSFEAAQQKAMEFSEKEKMTAIVRSVDSL